MTQPVISAYENGTRSPSLPMLTKLVEATGHDLRIELDPQAPPVRGLPDTPMGRRLRRHRRAIIAAANARGAGNVRVFGSVARGEDTEESDVDLLVDFGERVSLLDIAGLGVDLEDLIGRPVDVVPARMLKAHVAPSALADAIAL